MPIVEDASIGRIFRDESGRSVATLIRMFGDIDLAEDVVQEAFALALRKWPVEGLPPSPGGWITTTARNRAIDHLRREARGRELLRQAVEVPAARPAERLVRAKHKIKAAHIPYRVPSEAELPERLRPVLAVLYLTYNAGTDRPPGDDLRHEAIRLTRAMSGLMPDVAEAAGLLALLLLTESRWPARVSLDGALILLRDQDRSLWDRALIEEGHAIVRACLRRNQPGPYQIQAAINAVHADAACMDATDWSQILALYDHLLAITPTPVVAMNRAIALAEVEGPQAGLDILDDLDLDEYHLFHAARADLLRRLGRHETAQSPG